MITLDHLKLRPKHGGEWNWCRQGIPWLGFVIYPNRIRLNRQCRKRLRRQSKSLERAALKGEITEKELEDRGRSLWAHALVADDAAWRQMVISRSVWTGWDEATIWAFGSVWGLVRRGKPSAGRRPFPRCPIFGPGGRNQRQALGRPGYPNARGERGC